MSKFRQYQGNPQWLFEPGTGQLAHYNRQTHVDVPILDGNTTSAPLLNRATISSNNTTGKAKVGDIITVTAPPGMALSNIQGLINKGAGNVAVSGFTGATYTLTASEIAPAGQSWPLMVQASLSTIMTDVLTLSNPISEPAAPTIGTATAGNQTVSFGYTAPSDNGGSAITTYDAFLYVNGVLERTLKNVPNPAVFTSAQYVENGKTYQGAVRANNIIGAGPLSALSNAVTPTNAAAAPVFTAAPTFNSPPTSGSTLSVVDGTYTGSAQTQSKTIYKDGIDVGDNYQVTQRDLQAQFQGVHILTNASGTVAAGTAIASGIQDTTLAPAFTTAGGIGLPANPYLMSTEVAAGFEVRMYTGTRTAGATFANGFEIASSLAGPWAEDLTGTVRTAPYRGYKTTAGMAGKFIRAWADLGGTGSNPQARYYTDPIAIVAPGTRSGEIVTVSSANRLALKGTARPNKVTKSLTTYTHTVGSAPIDSIVLDLCNIITDGAFTTSGSGFARTFEAIDIVYQGVVYQPRFGGVIPSTGTPLVVADGATEVRSDPVTTTVAFGASWPVIIPGEDILVRFRELYVANQIVPLVEANDNLSFGSPTAFYDPATDTVSNDVGNTNAGNNYRTTVTGAGVTNTGIGPIIMLLGTFAAKDAVTVFGAGDSRRAAQGTIGLHAPAYNRNIGKPPIANINCAYSGGNVYFMSSNALIQKYFKLCDTLVDGFGINTIQDVANTGNATSLINEAKNFWALFKANASAGANRRPARVFRTSLQFRFQPSGAVTGGDGTVVNFSNTFQHLQPSYPRMDLGGDIQNYFVPAMLAEVQSGNLAGYIEYRDRLALSRNPAQPGYYRTLPGRYGDGLHGGDGRVGAKMEYEAILRS